MQTEAQGQLQAADVRQKGLKKQLADQRRALASKEKEAGGLAQDLQKEQRKVEECSRRQAPPLRPSACSVSLIQQRHCSEVNSQGKAKERESDWTVWLCRLSALQYNEAAATQLRATVDLERAHVQRCRDHAEQLSTTLASMLPAHV